MDSEKAELETLLQQAKEIAVAYYRLTGKPLGITGEIGESVAAEKMGLSLSVARQVVYDAIDQNGRKIQIKSRVVGNPAKITGRVGATKVANEWDCVQLVIMTRDYEAVSIHEAGRESIIDAIGKSGSRARQKGALSIAEFQRLGTNIWP